MKYPKIRYMLKTLHHKWFVLRFGLKVKAPLWRLLIHDWTKFTPYELPAYADRFFGENKDQMAFAQAWNHHHKANPHHWEYWIPLTAHSKSPMGRWSPIGSGRSVPTMAGFRRASPIGHGSTPTVPK